MRSVVSVEDPDIGPCYGKIQQLWYHEPWPRLGVAGAPAGKLLALIAWYPPPPPHDVKLLEKTTQGLKVVIEAGPAHEWQTNSIIAFSNVEPIAVALLPFKKNTHFLVVRTHDQSD